MKHMRYIALFLVMITGALFAKKQDNLVYVLNESSTPINVSLTTNGADSQFIATAKMFNAKYDLQHTVKANDKDWIHEGGNCLLYITFTPQNGGQASHWRAPRLACTPDPALPRNAVLSITINTREDGRVHVTSWQDAQGQGAEWDELDEIPERPNYNPGRPGFGQRFGPQGNFGRPGFVPGQPGFGQDGFGRPGFQDRPDLRLGEQNRPGDRGGYGRPNDFGQRGNWQQGGQGQQRQRFQPRERVNQPRQDDHRDRSHENN